MTKRSIQDLEHEIAIAKESLKEVRSAKVRQEQLTEANLDQLRNKLEVLRECFHKRLQRKNDLSIYNVIMRQVHTFKSQPDSITFRKQVTMLRISHQMEVLRKAMDELNYQTNSLTAYMKCEITVLQEELDDILSDFVKQKQLKLVDWIAIEDPLKHKCCVQENAMHYLQSLLKLQQEIQHPSPCIQRQRILFNSTLDNDSISSSQNSSIATLDLNQSLSLVSSTFMDSFHKLPKWQKETRDQRQNSTSLTDIMKQLLILDGTFPTEPEDDDLLENSSRDWGRLEELLASH